MRNVKLIMVTILLCSNSLHAAQEDVKNKWVSTAALGYVATSGNTSTKTLNVKGTLSNEREIWRHNGDISAINTKDGERTTAERYRANWQSDYKLTKQDYFFATLGYENDRFSGFDYQVTEALGYGRRVLGTDKLTLDLEIGPGARQSKVTEGDRNNEFMVRGAGRFAWLISEGSKFAQELIYDAGQDTDITRSTTSLTSKIADSLSMKISYFIRHQSDVPPDVKKTDTETSVTLVYTF